MLSDLVNELKVRWTGMAEKKRQAQQDRLVRAVESSPTVGDATPYLIRLSEMEGVDVLSLLYQTIGKETIPVSPHTLDAILTHAPYRKAIQQGVALGQKLTGSDVEIDLLTQREGHYQTLIDTLSSSMKESRTIQEVLGIVATYEKVCAASNHDLGPKEYSIHGWPADAEIYGTSINILLATLKNRVETLPNSELAQDDFVQFYEFMENTIEHLARKNNSPWETNARLEEIQHIYDARTEGKPPLEFRER